jgi:uncharacterized membrane protein YecN with MAPEG domain
MALSEHEQRLLDQIEQALYAEDPKFAANVRSVRRHTLRRRWIPISIVGALAGLTVVLVGLVAKEIAVSVLGFVLIVASCAYAAGMLSRKSQPATDAVSGKAGPRAQARQQGIRSRMEDRLRRRFDES